MPGLMPAERGLLRLGRFGYPKREALAYPGKRRSYVAVA